MVSEDKGQGREHPDIPHSAEAERALKLCSSHPPRDLHAEYKVLGVNGSWWTPKHCLRSASFLHNPERQAFQSF